MATDLREPAIGQMSPSPRWQRIVLLGLIELLVAAAGYLVYSLSTGAVHEHQALAFHNASRVIAFEQGLHLFQEARLQSLVLPHMWLVQTFNAIYMWGHLPLIIVTVVWLFLFHRDRYRTFRNALLISGAIALIVFFLFPVAPPRLVPGLNLKDTAALISPVYDTVEPKVFFNPYAAMPSMHIAWDLLLGISFIWCSRQLWLRWFGVILPAGMLFAVVVTGNHYIVDGVAGALLGLLGLAIALEMEHLRLGHGLTGPVGAGK